MKTMLISRIMVMIKQKGFIISMTAMLFFSISSFIFYAKSFEGKDTSQIINGVNLLATSARSIFIGYFEMIFPFICIMPFSFSYITDKNENNISVIALRSDKRKYYTANAIAIFIGSFLILFLPLTINLILNLSTFPLNSMVDDTNMNTFSSVHINEYWKKYIFADLYVTQPVLYNILFIIIPSFFSGIVGLFVYSISFFIKGNKVLLFFPFYIIHYLLATFENKFGINIYYFRYIIPLEVVQDKSVVFFILLNLFMIVFSFFTIIRKSGSDEL